MGKGTPRAYRCGVVRHGKRPAARTAGERMVAHDACQWSACGKLANRALRDAAACRDSERGPRRNTQSPRSQAAIPALPAASDARPDSTSLPSPNADPGMLDSIECVRHVMQQAISAEVRRALLDGREYGATSPDAARQSLAITAEHVRSALELDPPQLAALLSQIAAARRVIDANVVAIRRQDDQRLQTVLERQVRTDGQRARLSHEEATADGIARANQLAARGQNRRFETEGLQIARQNRTRSSARPWRSNQRCAPMSSKGEFSERRQRSNSAEFRAQEAMLAVESDDPPVKYSSAAHWQDLTERRKKWREASTYQPTPGEAKIREALLQECSIDFQNIPIEDALDYLKTKHGIEIQLDQQALSDLAIGPSTPVTRSASRIRLRSALRLILEDLGLTWVVRDDVLLVTSVERADSMTTTRVYDVADLVIPIPPPQGRGVRGYGGYRGYGGHHHFRLPGGMPF